jgi:hypothetical protein
MFLAMGFMIFILFNLLFWSVTAGRRGESQSHIDSAGAMQIALFGGVAARALGRRPSTAKADIFRSPGL